MDYATNENDIEFKPRCWILSARDLVFLEILGCDVLLCRMHEFDGSISNRVMTLLGGQCLRNYPVAGSGSGRIALAH